MRINTAFGGNWRWGGGGGGGLMVSALNSGSKFPVMSAGRGACKLLCVLGQDSLLSQCLSLSVQKLKCVLATTCDELASRPVGKTI